MPRQSVGEQSGVVIDWCRDHGLWFDRDELPRTLAWVRRGGAVEINKKRAAKAAEKPREEACGEGGPIGPLFETPADDDWDWTSLFIYALAILARIFFAR
jgi:hypothetical protein